MNSLNKKILILVITFLAIGAVFFISLRFFNLKKSPNTASEDFLTIINDNQNLSFHLNSSNKAHLLLETIQTTSPEIKQIEIHFVPQPLKSGINKNWIDNGSEVTYIAYGGSIQGKKWIANLYVNSSIIKKVNWTNEQLADEVEYSVYQAVIFQKDKFTSGNVLENSATSLRNEFLSKYGDEKFFTVTQK